MHVHQSWAESEITDSESAQHPKTLHLDKILLLYMEVMLNIGSKCLGVAFISKAMPKLNYQDVLFQELPCGG